MLNLKTKAPERVGGRRKLNPSFLIAIAAAAALTVVLSLSYVRVDTSGMRSLTVKIGSCDALYNSLYLAVANQRGGKKLPVYLEDGAVMMPVKFFGGVLVDYSLIDVSDYYKREMIAVKFIKDQDLIFMVPEESAVYIMRLDTGYFSKQILPDEYSPLKWREFDENDIPVLCVSADFTSDFFKLKRDFFPSEDGTGGYACYTMYGEAQDPESEYTKEMLEAYKRIVEDNVSELN